MWTRDVHETQLENLVVYLVKRDGVAKFYTVMPAGGYLVRVPALDTEMRAEDGTNTVVPYVSRGGGTEVLSYDWQTNPKGYAAVAETEGLAIC